MLKKNKIGKKMSNPTTKCYFIFINKKGYLKNWQINLFGGKESWVKPKKKIPPSLSISMAGWKKKSGSFSLLRLFALIFFLWLLLPYTHFSFVFNI